MADYRNVHKLFFAWNYEKEENYINEQSKAGWQIVKGGCFSSTYVHDPDSRYITRLDFNPEILKDAGARERYVQPFEDMGWEHLNTTFNGWSFFRKKYVPGTPEEDYIIYTDRDSLHSMLRRICSLMAVLRILVAIAAVILLILSVTADNPSYWIELIIYIGLFIFISLGVSKIKARMPKENQDL